MATIVLKSHQDEFVIHFGVQGERINAYTLASTLISIADAARLANAQLNPGYEVEILVEALGAGSFRARIRSLYRGAENLFSKETLKAVVLGVIVNFVYQHTLAPDTDVNVIVNTNEVVIEQGETRVVVPREIHEATKQVEKNQKFRQSVSGIAAAVDADKTVSSVAFGPPDNGDLPLVEIPRERFQALAADINASDGGSRELVQLAEVEILRAILELSRRRWEFAWSGVRIAAPVLDRSFYDRFAAHEITIAPGDRLRVRLKIKQKRRPDSGVFMNESYEVIEVLTHIPRAVQRQIESGR